MKSTFIISLLLIGSALGYAQSPQDRFTMEAVSLFCYQDAADAVEAAQRVAEEKAARQCGELGVERLSAWSRELIGERCRAIVRAEFRCFKSLK